MKNDLVEGVTDKSSVLPAIAFILYFGLVILFSTHADLQTFYFQYDTKVAPIFTLTGALVITAILRKGIFLDHRAFLLLFRSVLLLMPYLYTTATYGYWGNYASTLLSVLSYILVMNCRIADRERFLDILLGLVTVIISFQLVVSTVKLFSRYGVVYKHLVRLPIGDSNYIAAFLVPCYAYYLFGTHDKQRNMWLGIVSVGGILLTYSKGALFTSVLVSIVKIMVEIRRKKHPVKLMISTILVLVLLTLSFAYLIRTEVGFAVYENTIAKIIHSGSTNLDDYLSGRLTVYRKNIDRFLSSFLLGDGTGFDLNYMGYIDTSVGRAHNWIIELLVQSGIIGFPFYFLPIWNIMRRTSRIVKVDPLQLRIFIAVTAILVHGLVEPNLFSPHFDVFFWALLGVCETGNGCYYRKTRLRAV